MTTSANYDTAVQELYVTYFGRPADPGGLSNFASDLAAAGVPTDLVGLYNAYTTNPTVKVLIDAFGTSTESLKLYGDTSSQAGVQTFVNDVFENLFGRSANPEGLAFWSNAILSGSVTQGNAALAIAAGAVQNKTAQGLLDAEAVTNKVAVASAFTSDLQIPQQISAYSGAAAAASARALLSAVSATTDPATFGQAIGSTIYNIANPNVGQSYYLTTGIDHLTGNQAADFFNAVIDNAAGVAAGGPAATLNSGDVLTGVSASNTLYITDAGVGGYFALPGGITLTNITLLQVTAQESVSDTSAPNGALDLSKIGIGEIDVFGASGTNAIKVAPGTKLGFDVAHGTVTTYGGSVVSVSGDRSIQAENLPPNVINGDASTNAVTVESGFAYLVNDVNFGKGKVNSISSVNVLGTLGNVTIDSDAVTKLVANYEALGAVITVNAAAGARSLAISLDADVNATIGDQTATIVNISTVSEAASSVDPASSNVNFLFNSAQSVKFAGAIDLAAANLVAPSATKLSLAGSGDFTLSSVTLHDGANIDASGTSGSINLNLIGSVGFVGGAGTDTITINAAPSGAFTGGSAGNNEIVLSNFASASASALSQVSHFATLGIAGATSGTFDLGAMSGIGTLDLHANSGNEVFINVSSGLHVDISDAGNFSLTLQNADSHGATDTQSVYIGSSTSYGNLVSQLTVEDASGNGIATLDLISNTGLQSNYGFAAIVDPGLSALNLSGAATIQVEAPIADSVAQVSISSNSGSSSNYIAGLTDANLSNLSVSGGVQLSMGAVSSSVTSLTITDNDNAGFNMVSLSDTHLTSATITNNSTAPLQITSTYMPLPALTELNLNGDVSIFVMGVRSQTGFTINGATDNAGVSFDAGYAQVGAGGTESITLGNGLGKDLEMGSGAAGSTQIVTLGDGSVSIATSTQGSFTLTAGSNGGGEDNIHLGGSPSAVNITLANNGPAIIDSYSSLSLHISLGSGSNLVNCTGAGTNGQLSFAAHTASDLVNVPALGASVDLTHILTVSGLNNDGSDSLMFFDSHGNTLSVGSLQQVTAAQVSGDPGQLTSWVAAAVGQGGLVPQSRVEVMWFQFGGNTYLVESPSGGDAGVVNANDSVVALTGLGYTFAHSTINVILDLKG